MSDWKATGKEAAAAVGELVKRATLKTSEVWPMTDKQNWLLERLAQVVVVLAMRAWDIGASVLVEPEGRGASKIQRDPL